MHLCNASKLSPSLGLNKEPHEAVKSVKLHANMKHETLTHPTQNNDATQKGKISFCLSFTTLYHRRTEEPAAISSVWNYTMCLDLTVL